MREWPGSEEFVRLRQWPTLVDLAARAEAMSAVAGAAFIGSFATGNADDFSDVDVIVLVREGRFREAWGQRSSLHARDVLFAWDARDPRVEEAGARKWLSRDVIKVECLMATPSSGVRLAGPLAVFAGDPSAFDAVPRAEPFTRESLDEYAEELRERGASPGVEARYGDLMHLLREERAAASK